MNCLDAHEFPFGMQLVNSVFHVVGDFGELVAVDFGYAIELYLRAWHAASRELISY